MTDYACHFSNFTTEIQSTNKVAINFEVRHAIPYAVSRRFPKMAVLAHPTSGQEGYLVDKVK
jgi:hypothetical protein